MQFMISVKSSEAAMAANPPPPEFMAAMGRYVQEMEKSGLLVTTGGLLPSLHGAKVRLAKGKLSITDGPFTEAKEIVGGFAIVEARDRQHAVQLASEFLRVHDSWHGWEGECEIRAMEPM